MCNICTDSLVLLASPSTGLLFAEKNPGFIKRFYSFAL